MHPTEEIVDFHALYSMPVAQQNNCINDSKADKSPILPLKNINTSSTNSRCVRMQLLVILIPWIRSSMGSSAMSHLRPSITSRNRRGERGKPYQRPRSE